MNNVARQPTLLCLVGQLSLHAGTEGQHTQNPVSCRHEAEQHKEQLPFSLNMF
jgi:hypothetical protein